MRTIEIKIYQFDELSEQAKQKAISDHRQYLQDEDHWRGERLASYRAAEKIYEQLHDIEKPLSGGRLVAWIQNNLSHHWENLNFISKHTDGTIKNSDWQYKHECTKKKLSRVFRTNNIENCPLTGVCYDYDFLKPIIDFLKKPDSRTDNTDLELPSYESVYERDFEGMDDHYIKDEIRANSYEFTEEGELL